MHSLSLVRRDAESPHALVRGMRDRILPFLARVASPVERQLYIDGLAKDLEMSSAAIADELLEYQRTVRTPAAANAAHAAQSQATAGAAAVSGMKQDHSLSSIARVLAVVDRYPHPDNEKLVAPLKTLAFEGEAFTMPEALSDEQKVSAFAIIEAEYGLLDEPARLLLIRELVQKVIDEFFAGLRVSYTTRMKEAERSGDEEMATALLAKLQTITAHRHIS